MANIMQCEKTTTDRPLNPFALVILPCGPALFQEEEEDGGGGPDYNVMSLWNDKDLVEAFRNWTTSVRSKSYKFIAVVLETSQTSLEVKLNNHIADNADFYDVESGSDLLVVHNCSRFGPNPTIGELTRRASLSSDTLSRS